MADDPFSNAHRTAERKAVADAATKEVIARDARVAAAEKARKAPRPAPKFYTPEKPFFR